MAVTPTNPIQNPKQFYPEKIVINLYTSYYAYFRKYYDQYPEGLPLLVTSTTVDRFRNGELREKLDITYQQLLMPPVALVKNYHAKLANQEGSREQIEDEYREKYLLVLEERFGDLTVHPNFADLLRLIINHRGAVFFCYEKAFSSFCHRYILVEWLADKLARCYDGSGLTVYFREFEVGRK